MKLKEKYDRLIGDCPKKTHCDIYRNDAEPCRNGPHQHCDKYRLTIEPKKTKTDPANIGAF